jgi:hypothetical protein
MGCGVHKPRAYECPPDTLKYTSGDPDMRTLPRIIAIFSKNGQFAADRIEAAMRQLEDHCDTIACNRANVFNVALLYFHILCRNDNMRIAAILRTIPADCEHLRDLLLGELIPGGC